jgi:PD-(D/E)XK nuclease family transposase
MLANLDNEVHFKKVFTDIDVFCGFVKDVVGVDMHITKVETEKVLQTKVSAIKFRMDLFAEDNETRTVVEIQKVEYDYAFDRFTHYFMGNLIDMQRTSRDYSFAKEVYVIVIVTAAYRISEQNGKPIKDDVLITDINPRTLKGELRNLYNHKMVVLNTAHLKGDTPSEIKDWLDLIVESMQNPENPKINTNKPAIAKAAQLAELNNISPEQLAEAKIEEMKKMNIALIVDDERKQGEIKTKVAVNQAVSSTEKRVKDEGIEKALKRGRLSHQEIAEDFEVTVDYVQRVEKMV